MKINKAISDIVWPAYISATSSMARHYRAEGVGPANFYNYRSKTFLKNKRKGY